MWGFFHCLLLVAICLHQVGTIKSECKDISGTEGNITKIFDWNYYNRHKECWNILNPKNQLLQIKLIDLDFNKKSCRSVRLTITENRSGKHFQWCHGTTKNNTIEVYSNVTVQLISDSNDFYSFQGRIFELHYNIDETIKGVEHVKEARSQVVSWLKSNWYSWKWINQISKIVTALTLIEGPYFDVNNDTDKLILKQRDLQMSVSLLRDTDSNEQLATFINTLLSTCHNPRDFHGYNLVELLKKQVEWQNFTHPAAYLALCNANETWPQKAYRDLGDTFDPDFFIPFKKDYEAFGVMALSCKIRRSGRDSVPKERRLLMYYENSIEAFKNLQKPNGSFGSFHRTALITQALFASGYENGSDWDMINAAKFLSQLVPSTDIILTYLILPLLNGKSLTDVAFVNCSSTRSDDDIVSEIDGYLGPKIKVQYSLLTGDGEDIIPTIFLKVPKNFSAFEVMQFIALKETKYKFKYDLESNKIDVHEMVGISNDPEEGKFWLFYLKKASGGNQFTHMTLGPGRTFLEEGDHIAMWFRKAPIHER